MRPFIGSLLAIAFIAVLSSFVLENMDMSAQDVFQSQTGNVRLDSGTK
jgi:predicted outer membrane lipoprotein